jgi:hypothetical protein
MIKGSKAHLKEMEKHIDFSSGLIHIDLKEVEKMTW